MNFKYVFLIWGLFFAFLTFGTKLFWLLGIAAVLGIIGGVMSASSEKKEEETPPLDPNKTNDNSSLKLADIDYYDDDDYDDLLDRLDDLEDRLQDLEYEREDALFEAEMREDEELEIEEQQEKIEKLMEEIKVLKERNRQLHHAIKRLPRK